jgi:hypothetical protein
MMAFNDFRAVMSQEMPPVPSTQIVVCAFCFLAEINER